MAGASLPLKFILALAVAFGISGLVAEACQSFFDDFEESSSLSLQKRSVSSDERELCKEGKEAPKNRVDTSDRLRRLRLQMKASSHDAYIIPSNDEHQSEYVIDYDKRMRFISGFSGSSGSAVVLQNKSALWTDSRYYLQADQEMDCNWILMKMFKKGTPSIFEWLGKELSPGSKVGFDPKMITEYQWMKWEKEFKKVNIRLQEDKSNLIDSIWSIAQGRSPESIGRLFVHEIKYSGKSWQDKIKDLRKVLLEKGAYGTIISALDEIAWLFNLRAAEFSYTPVFKAYAFVSEDHIRLYVKSLKLTDDVKRHLKSIGCSNSECVEIKEYSAAFEDIAMLLSEKDEKILLSHYSSHSIINLVPQDKRIIEEGSSPVIDLRAVKNTVEIQGMKAAHVRDSVAIVDFIAFLESEISDGKQWDEIKASSALRNFRAHQELNRGESFETISAFGPNGALVHYVPQNSTNRHITNTNLYLLDSGGQYLDGTTDITRTFHFGTPSDFQKETYTRVLMGAINLMSAVFQSGVRDVDLDILARQPLYEIGLNYGHGTGHGIGAFLGVHEDPVRISQPRHGKFGHELKPGMFMSDEPGYYETGKFGIRLETTMMVVNAYTPHRFGNAEFYTFEPVALVPFEPKLIKYELLSTKQKQWLNKFNAKVRNVIGVELRKQGRERGFQWLHARTEDIPIRKCANSGSSWTVNVFVYLLTFVNGFMFIMW